MNKKIVLAILYFLFAVFSIWWAYLTINVSAENELRGYFSDSYGILAGFGGIAGLWISRKWGGIRSVFGRAITFLSIGLLFQFLGQFSYSLEYYLYGIKNSYPSFGEIFFLASIPAYIVGIWEIGRTSGTGISLKKFHNKIGAIVIPFLLVSISYYLFVHGSDISELPLLEKILFVSYPVGQTIFVSLAVVAYYLTIGVLGGKMQTKVIFILFSLVFQYVADIVFIYRTTLEIWYPADITEYVFAVSYFLMAIALIDFWHTPKLEKNVQ